MINENITIALIISAAPTLAVLGSTYVSLKKARQQDNKQNDKLDEIHYLTNKSFSRALDKIDRLEKIIRENKENRQNI